MAVLDILGIETGNTSEFFSITAGSASSTARTGGYSLLNPSNADTRDNDSATNGYSEPDIIARFAFRFASAPSSIAIIANLRGTASAEAQLELNTDRTLRVTARGGTAQNGSTALAVDTWHVIELKYEAGTGSDAIAEVRLAGSVEATSNDGTTVNNVQLFRLIRGSVSLGDTRYDDIRVDSGTTYPGDGQISALRPDGDSTDSGEDEFTSNVAEPSFDEVDDDGPNDSTFADSSSGAGEVDQLWTLTTVTVATINHVRVGIRAQRQNGAGRTHHIRWKKSGGTAENSADLVLGVAFAYFTFDPSDQPTTQGQLDGSQAGGAVSASAGRVMELSECYVMVDYTTTAPSAVLQDVIGLGVVPFPR